MTITGPAGVGKTRLALAIAHDIASSFADGAFFVDLTPVRERTLVMPAIAQVLGVRARGDQTSSEAVTAFLKTRQTLLVLDNFEQILPAAPDVAALLSSCPVLQVLATSRAPLRIRGEHLLPVRPLPIPESHERFDIEALRRSDAVALFTQRARAANPAFALTAANAETVSDICVRTDGLPLAIELAATGLRHISVEDLSNRLTHRLRVLVDGERDAPNRQRTLRDAIAWSYDLLSRDEQAFFRRCGVFAGGFDEEAAAAIAGCNAGTVLGALVDHNLVLLHELSDGGVRYGLLESVREFALERLEHSNEVATAERTHAEHYFGRAKQAEANIYRAKPRESLDTLEIEYFNCRAALGYFAANLDADAELWMASWISEFWFNRGRLAEGIRCLSDALDRGGHAAAISRAKAMIELSLLFRETGDCDKALDLAAAAETLARNGSDEYRLAQVLFARAWTIGACLNAWPNVVPLLEESLDRSVAGAPHSGLRWGALADLGWAVTRLGERDRGRAMIEQALETVRPREWGFEVIKYLTMIGLLNQEEKNAAAAADCYRQALALSGEIGFTMRAIYPLAGLAALAMGRGDPWTAARLLGMVESVWHQTGAGSSTPRLEKWQDGADAAQRQALAQLGEVDYSVRVAAARDLSVTAAIAEAIPIAEAIISGNPVRPPRASDSRPANGRSTRHSPPKLSPRENEVLSLLAQRWTAPEMAERLSISERTIETHIANIYNRFGVNSRREAVTFAASHGLIPDLPDYSE